MPRPCVKDGRSAYRWPSDYASAVAVVHRLDHVSGFFRKLTFSSAFSGICAPSVGMHMLSCGLSEQHGRAVDREYYQAIDWYSESQQELMTLPKPPQHLFGNIELFCSPKTQAKLNGLPKETKMEFLEDLILNTPGAVLTHTSACVSCTTRCYPSTCCAMRHTYLHIAGTPCKDFSTQNNSWPGLGGKTTRHLLIWVALMRLVLPLVIICENVPSFPLRILVKYLPMYAIDTVVLSNLGFGHCIERRRRYTTLHLRSEVRLVRELACIEPCLGRDRDTQSHTWSQYLVAQDGELAQELGWASARFPGAAPSTMSGDDAFYKALNHWEKTPRQGQSQSSWTVLHTYARCRQAEVLE